MAEKKGTYRDCVLKNELTEECCSKSTKGQTSKLNMGYQNWSRRLARGMK
jgi:hypothetical protein